MEEINEKVLEEIIRKIIMEKIGDSNTDVGFEKHVDPSGVSCVKTNTVKTEIFEDAKLGEKVKLKDVFSLEESPRLGCGVMEMEKASFPWTLKYDEIDYIIEGTLEIDIDGRKVIGNKGDIIHIPKNSSIHFTVPDYARFIYVVYPANWAEL